MQTQSKTVFLHGKLAKKYGKKHTIDADNIRQIMSALIRKLGNEFREEIRTGEWHITNGAIKKGNDLAESHLDKNLKKNTIHLLPAVQGASAVLRVIVGIVLIVVGVYFDQPWLVNLGVSMVLGGVVEMLTKPNTPDNAKIQDEGGGSIYNSAQNVTTQGGPVPLAFGRIRRASSTVIGTDFSSEQVPYIAPATTPNDWQDYTPESP